MKVEGSSVHGTGIIGGWKGVGERNSFEGRNGEEEQRQRLNWTMRRGVAEIIRVKVVGKG